MRKLSSALAVLLLSAIATAQCIQASGTPITVLPDSINGPHAIGFAFPFDGSTYTDIHISDHGITFLSNGAVPAIPMALPLVYTPVAASLVANGPVICPFWSDTNPSGTSQFTINSQPTVTIITWFEVVSYGSTTPRMSFQMEMHSNGNLKFIYGPNLTNASTFAAPSDNGVVGVSPGMPATLPLSSDMASSPSTTNPTIFEHWLTANGFDMAGDTLLLIPTSPGWVVIHTDGGAGCANNEAFGNGCDGLVLTSNSPVHGMNWDLTTTGINAVSPFSFTLFGFTRQTPALPLSNFGVNSPGCDANIVPLQVMLIAAVTSGTSSVSLAMPLSTAYTGIHLVAQTMAQTTTFASGVATSNAVDGTLGN